MSIYNFISSPDHSDVPQDGKTVALEPAAATASAEENAWFPGAEPSQEVPWG